MSIFKILALVVLLQINLCADSIYFMPYDANKALKHLISEIKGAKNNVRISIYTFTNREIAKAIRDSAKRGVKFEIIFDESQNLKSDKSQIGYLAKLKNISVCTLKGRRASTNKYNGIMHQKIAIIDDKRIIFGSANWSKSAFELNYEVLVISDNETYLASANKFFAKMKTECKGY